MLRQPKARLAHPRIEPDIADKLLRRAKAADVADRRDETCGYDDVDASNGQEAFDGRIFDHFLGDFAVEKLEVFGQPVKLTQMPLDGGLLIVRQCLAQMRRALFC